MRYLLIALFLFSNLFIFSQEKYIGGYINTNTTLHPDTTYIVDYNTRVSSNSKLTILANTTLLLNSGVAIIIDGDLDIKGELGKEVNIQSLDKQYQALGIVINGYNGENIEIDYCNFSHLLVPLNFKNGWFRKTAFITNNTFKHINSGQESILIGNVSQKNIEDESYLNFSSNTFSENNASIYISSFEYENLELVFNDNVISSNYIIGKEKSNPFNAVFSGEYNQFNLSHKIEFNNNSIFDNILISGINNTENIELNIGINGEGETFDIKNNFLGNPENAHSTVIHFKQNNNLPNLELINLQKKPSSSLAPHIWKILIEENEKWKIWDNQNMSLTNKNDIKLRLFYNKEVLIDTTQTLDYLHYNEQAKKIDTIILNASYNSISAQEILCTIKNPERIKKFDGTLILPQTKDKNNTTTVNKRIGNFNPIVFTEQGTIEEYLIEETHTTFSSFEISEESKRNFKRSINVGTLLGSNYFIGDASNDGFDASFGMFIYYSLSPEIKFKGSYLSTNLNTRFPDNFSESYKIKTQVNSLTLSGYYFLYELKNYQIKFDFHMGLSVFRFQPKGQYNGFLYGLNNFNTEENVYSLNQIAVPLGFSIQKEVFNFLTVGLELIYHKTFTDYLDDISGNYADYQNILDERGEIAAYFSDPSRVNNEFDYQKEDPRGNTSSTDSFVSVLFSISKSLK